MKHENLSLRALAEQMGVHAQIYRPYAFDLIDSTNAEAKRLALSGEEYALICADAQSAGRGRLGRSFHSPAGTGVYVSILHTFRAPAADAVAITSAASVAVMRAILCVCGLQTEIKWVNDLYLDGKKVAGILAEGIVDPANTGKCAVVLGIGINLRPADFPPALADIATTLGDQDASREALIGAILEEMIPYLENPAARDWLDDYRGHSCVLGRAITWSRGGAVQSGTAVDIDPDGALLVLDANGSTIRLATGEISLRVVEG